MIIALILIKLLFVIYIFASGIVRVDDPIFYLAILIGIVGTFDSYYDTAKYVEVKGYFRGNTWVKSYSRLIARPEFAKLAVRIFKSIIIIALIVAGFVVGDEKLLITFSLTAIVDTIYYIYKLGIRSKSSSL